MKWLRRAAVVLPLAWLGGCAVLAAVVHYTGASSVSARTEVIIVLGAAITDRGAPGPALTRRATHAAALWKSGQGGMIICTGGIGPALRVRRSEADGCREVLMREGVPAQTIILEEASRNTEENLHNVRALMVARGWTRATLVSDSYHMCRARLIGRRMGLDVVPNPVPADRVASPLFYLHAVVREVAALHVQVWKWPR